jgi:hypothetical protein
MRCSAICGGSWAIPRADEAGETGRKRDCSHSGHVTPPSNGGSIGLFGSSESAASDAWRFAEIVVVEND